MSWFSGSTTPKAQVAWKLSQEWQEKRKVVIDTLLKQAPAEVENIITSAASELGVANLKLRIRRLECMNKVQRITDGEIQSVQSAILEWAAKEGFRTEIGRGLHISISWEHVDEENSDLDEEDTTEEDSE